MWCGAGRQISEKLFFSAFFCLESRDKDIDSPRSTATGSSVPYLKSRASSTVLSLSAVNGLTPSNVVLCRPRSFNSQSFE